MISSHVHHWVVERPSGPMSKGRCACGAEREFANSYEIIVRKNNDGMFRRRGRFNTFRGKRKSP